MTRKNTSKNTDFSIGGSIFWIIFILLGLMGAIFIGIWGFQNQNVQAAIIYSIISGLIIAGLVFSRFEIFNIGTWAQNSVSFTLGFFLWILIGRNQQSVLSISQNELFSSISSELPLFMEFAIGTFIIPTAEELFWMIAIPFSLITVLNIVGKTYFKPLLNPWIQLLIIVIVAGVTFAGFHVGNLFLPFLIAAFIFRTVMIVSVVGDQLINWWKGFMLLPSFALGAHIANNWADFGFRQGINLLVENIGFGWIAFVLFGFIFLTALSQMIELVFKRKSGSGG